MVHSPEGPSETEATNLLKVGVLAEGIILQHIVTPLLHVITHGIMLMLHLWVANIICQDVVLSYFLQLRSLPGQAVSTSIQDLSSSHIHICLIFTESW